MLLNQCLAISLSPIDRNSGIGSGAPSQLKSEHLAQDPTIKQASAFKLFQKLIASHQLEPETSSRSQLEFEKRDDSQESQYSKSFKILAESLSRVEFAGFVVPSWLLISGSFDDLHCIKSSWSAGILRPPSEFRIETIGK